jgi:hypothetical protein
MCDSPVEAGHHHTLGPKLGASHLTLHLADLREKAVQFLYAIFYIAQFSLISSLSGLNKSLFSPEICNSYVFPPKVKSRKGNGRGLF